MAKAPNAIKQLYRQVRSRLMSQARRLEKMGFSGAREKIPSIPKKITEGSIRRLEKLAKDKYRGLKEGLTTEKGETVREVEYERRKESARKAKESRQRYVDEDTGEIMTKSQYAENVIENYYDELGDYNDAFSNYMRNYIDELIQRYGRWDVAVMINRMAEENVLPSRWQMYTKEGAFTYTHEMFSYMPEIRSGEDMMAMDAYSKSLMADTADAFNTMRTDYNNERRRAREAQRR